MVIRENPGIRTLANFPNLFSKNYFSISRETSYRPVGTLTYMLNYSIWKLNTTGYKLSSVGIHIFNACLVFILINLLFGSNLLSFFSALLFVAHPINNETVLVASFNEDLLVFMFSLLAFISYLKFKSFFISAVLYALALFSKESSVALLVIFPLYAVCFVPKGKITGHFKNKKYFYISYIFVTIFYALVTFVFLKNPDPAIIEYPGGSFYTNLLTMSKVFVQYLKLYAVPVNLCAEHIIPASISIFDRQVILSIAVIAGFIFLTIKMFNHSKRAFFAFCWIIAGLAPVMNFVPFLNVSLLAERYAYFSSFGFCMLLGITLSSLKKKEVRTFLIVSILIFYSSVVFTRNKDWKDHYTLWAKTSQQSPGSTKAHTNVGLDYLNQGMVDKAIFEFNEAIRLFPNNTIANANIADAYTKKGMYVQAIGSCENALKTDPNNIIAYNNMGIAYAKLNDFDKAVLNFKKMSEVDPNNASAYYNLGCLYALSEKFDDAIIYFQKALQLDPNSANTAEKLQRALSDRANHKRK